MLNISRSEEKSSESEAEKLFGESKEALQKWRAGTYQMDKISSESDIVYAMKKRKIFVIPFAERQSKSPLILSIIIILINIYFLWSIDDRLWILELLITGVCAPLSVIKFLEYRWQNKMKKIGYIIVGPEGVLYKFSKKKNGYFTWNSIKNIDGHWTHGSVLCKSPPLNDSWYANVNKTHYLCYKSLDHNEIPTFELFQLLMNSYWKKFQTITQPISKKATRIKPVSIFTIWFLGYVIFLEILGFIVILK